MSESVSFVPLSQFPGYGYAIGFCLMQMFLNVASLACCGAVSRLPADLCLWWLVVSYGAAPAIHLHIYTAQCNGLQLYCIYRFLWKTFHSCNAKGWGMLYWHLGVLSSKATKYHCLPIATPIRGNQGFLGELRLLDSSKNWPETALYLYVQRELLVMVGCSPEYFSACKKTVPGFIDICQTTSSTIHYNDKSFQLTHDGALVSASSVSVSPGVFCQDAQAVFLPHPRKCYVVSYPVMAWKSPQIGKVQDRSRYHGWEYREAFSHSRSQPKALPDQALGRSEWQGPRYHYQLF